MASYKVVDKFVPINGYDNAKNKCDIGLYRVIRNFSHDGPTSRRVELPDNSVTIISVSHAYIRSGNTTYNYGGDVDVYITSASTPFANPYLNIAINSLPSQMDRLSVEVILGKVPFECNLPDVE